MHDSWKWPRQEEWVTSPFWTFWPQFLLGSTSPWVGGSCATCCSPSSLAGKCSEQGGVWESENPWPSKGCPVIVPKAFSAISLEASRPFHHFQLPSLPSLQANPSWRADTRFTDARYNPCLPLQVSEPTWVWTSSQELYLCAFAVAIDLLESTHCVSF